MNAKEAGFLLLSSHLGNPARKPLTTGQLRELGSRMRQTEHPEEDRQLEITDLLALGYGREMANRILALLDEEELLKYYASLGAKLGCVPVTRVSNEYPPLLRQRLELDSPGCLWAKGDLSLLKTPCVSLVGSRELKAQNREFAAAVGKWAAREGYTLVSGNARGADRTAQTACLSAGGRVISIVADALAKQPLLPRVLYLSEDGFDEDFSSQRALSRNRCIHALGQLVLVAQAEVNKGGTWDGTAKNLRFGWSSVACFRDGSEASLELEQMGAYLIGIEDLEELRITRDSDYCFL